RTVELALRGIDKKILLVDVDDRGRRPFQAEREAISRGQSGADGQLRQKEVAALLHALPRPLLFSRGKGDSSAVLERQFNGPPKAELLRRRRLIDTQYCRPKTEIGRAHV